MADIFKALSKDGISYGSASTFKEAVDLGDRQAPQGETFFVKEGKRKGEEINALFRKELPRLRAIRNINFEGAFERVV